MGSALTAALLDLVKEGNMKRKKRCLRGHLRSAKNITSEYACKLCSRIKRIAKRKAYRLLFPLPPRKTHCLRGHLRTPENLTSNGSCKSCTSESHARIYKANKKKFITKARSWGMSNPVKVRAYKSKWAKNHPESARVRGATRRTRITKAGGSFTFKEFKEMCNKYDNRCLCCGKRRKLAADHVIPVSKGGSSNISNIQPLCFGKGGCNNRKGNKYADYRTTNPESGAKSTGAEQ